MSDRQPPDSDAEDSPAAPFITDFLDQMGQIDPEARYYREHGSARDSPALTDDAREKATWLMRAVDAAPKSCYKNAMLAAPLDPDVTYVEGYYHADRLPIPISHAWVEWNGHVLELTLPDAPDLADGATYYGVAFGDDMIERMTTEHGRADPLAWLALRDDDDTRTPDHE